MPRALLAAALCALAGAAPATAATTTPTILFSRSGTTATTLPVPPTTPAPPGKTQLTSDRAKQIFLTNTKVHDWLARYPGKGRATTATYDKARGSWDVSVTEPPAGEIAKGRVDDATGAVLEAWTGPQVAWTMARGYDGAFGGKWINDWRLWAAFSAAFLVGLVDFRRLLSLRNLDLVALLSFSISLWYFNKGHVLTSVPLVYPPLVYLLLRAIWIGTTGRGSRGRSIWPAAVLLAAAMFLGGLRVGLNIWTSNVIDVGYSGVIGAERIAHGQAPYGHFPLEQTKGGVELPKCGPADANGEVRERIQTNGRCESANPQGDTYGPVAYEAYLPGYALFGWSGKWDSLPSVHFTSIVFDLLCAIGLFLVGFRFGGLELATTLAFAWEAFPFTQYASSSNTNDMIMPAFLIWGFWLAASSFGRGVFAALAGWTKFAALIVAPLWSTYPDRRPKPQFLAGFVVASATAFSVFLLEPNVLHAAHLFWDRTVGWQMGRESPFSLWDWRQYHADGLPNLHRLQNALQALLVAAAVVLPFWPRRKSPLQLAALTAALLLGFQLVLTYWIYLYIPWFFAFSAIATLAPSPAARAEAAAVEPVRPAPLQAT